MSCLILEREKGFAFLILNTAKPAPLAHEAPAKERVGLGLGVNSAVDLHQRLCLKIEEVLSHLLCRHTR